MKTQAHLNRCFEFQFPDVDTRILVEDSEDGVVIHASRDTFSQRRKICFIRELAAEGFIADCFQWSGRGVHWLVDDSLARRRPDVASRTNRFMIRLFLGVVSLYLALMAGAILHGRDHQAVKAVTQSEVP
ncbi:MAG TPA: hypothetical protein VL486_16620 [Verrucomicrobiae bacterium]|nr:hypothetical protein [Verrucomicrobiae bacterium]